MVPAPTTPSLAMRMRKKRVRVDPLGANVPKV
jgi:hypothetical protein